MIKTDLPFFLSLKNVGLKFKYQFDEEIIEADKKNDEDDELPSKKLKLNISLNENKKITILKYSSVQLPVVPFIDYLDKYSKDFVDQCLKHKDFTKNKNN
jgi:hypothetical protein